MKSAGKIVALVVVIAVGLAAIYLVASNGGNKVAAPVDTAETAASKSEPESKPVATGPQPHIQFEETVYNWGTVYQNEKVIHIFKFKNVGQSDLEISKVQSG